MSIVSLQFFMFAAVTVALFYIVPKKIQWWLLLAASLAFYAFSGPIYILYILFSAFVSWLVGLKLGKLNTEMKDAARTAENPPEKKEIKKSYQKRMRKFVLLGILLVLAELVFVKYTTFLLGSVNGIFGFWSQDKLDAIQIIAPLGCSFYSFAIIGYIADVYRGRAKAQTNFAKYLLFVSYFPQIIQGPIPRFSDLSPQFFTEKSFDFERFRSGFLRIFWGVFKKLTIAEVLGTYVSAVYNDYANQSGTVLFIATVFFSIQIYADFSGYVDIVSGVSELFGIKLSENFNHPYFAKTIPEFWRRWHISLSSWFREYVFYAFSSSNMMLKLNKTTRQKLGNTVGRVVSVIIPVLLVWALTGLWHGAAWNYVAWGLFHGVIIMLSIIFEPTLKSATAKLKIKTESFSWQLYQILRTFFLCTVGRIFFRATSMQSALTIFKKVFTDISYPNVLGFGVTKLQFKAVFFACAVLLAVSLIGEYIGNVREWFFKQNVWFRWGVIWVLLLFILVCGQYGPNATTSFIYEQF